jgi:hypothetical protein
MKMSVKSIFGVMLSTAWLVAYVGGGAFLLARQATDNVDHVGAYVPFVLFIWVVGFFLGHCAIEKFFLTLFQSEHFAWGVRKQPQVLDIDSSRVATVPVYEKNTQSILIYSSKKNRNPKKDTSKILSLHKAALNIYKIA